MRHHEPSHQFLANPIEGVWILIAGKSSANLECFACRWHDSLPLYLQRARQSLIWQPLLLLEIVANPRASAQRVKGWYFKTSSGRR